MKYNLASVSKRVRRCTHKTNICRRFQLALFAFALDAHATTAVVVWTPDRIVLAADTCLSTQQDGRRVRIGTGCKIYHEGQIWLATAGLFSYPITGFHIRDIVHRGYSSALKSRDDIYWITTVIESEIGFGLDAAKDAVSESLKLNPDLNISEIAIVAGPSLRAEYRQMDISGMIKPLGQSRSNTRGIAYMGERSSIPSGMPYRMEMFAIGIRDHIFLHQLSHDDWRSLDPVDAARLFIQLEIDHHPEAVGLPMTIVVIERNGQFYWDDRQGACPHE